MSKQPRRKGNVKTASSAKAAELLTQSGHSIPFIGFDACTSFAANITESLETGSDDVDPRIRNVLKKMGKKDAFTREKGIKELSSLLNEVDATEIEKSFPHYVAVFPKLVLDGTLGIRNSSIRVMGSYIQILKKASGRYMKSVLPYVLFSTNDSYGQVVQSANTLLTSCFTEEKRVLAIDMCTGPACDVILQILRRSHPLLLKGEGEETENQRLSRITAQALNFLRNLAEKISSDEEQCRVLEVLRTKQFYKQLLALSSQVTSALCSLGSQLLILKWKGVLDTGLPSTALSLIDNSDRAVCRSAAGFFILASSNFPDELFTLLSMNKAVIPKIISLIRKKEIHWTHLEPDYILSLVNLVFLKLSPPENNTFLLRIFDSFFDGFPWDPSFNSSVWASALINLTEQLLQAISSSPSSSETSGDLDQLFSKVLHTQELVLHCTDTIVLDAFSSLLVNILSNSLKFPPDKFAFFRSDLFRNLLNRLPETEPQISKILSSGLGDCWIILSKMVAKSEAASEALLAHLIETGGNDLLRQLDSGVDISSVIIAKLSSSSEKISLPLLRGLIRILDATGRHLTEFASSLQLELESFSVALVEAVLSFKDVDIGPRVATPELWTASVCCSLLWTAKNNDPRFSVVVDAAGLLLDSDDIAKAMCEVTDEVSLQQLLIIAGKVASTAGREYREKISNGLVRRSLTPSVSEDLLKECVSRVLELGFEASTFAGYFDQLFANDHLGKSEVKQAALLASLLPAENWITFLIHTSDLNSLFSPLDNLVRVDILDVNEFLHGELLLRRKSSSLSQDQNSIKKAVYRALFVLEFLTRRGREKLNLSPEVASSLLYVIAVSALPLSSYGTYAEADLSLLAAIDKEAKDLVMYDENLRLHLLDWSYTHLDSCFSLSLLMAIRKLSAGLDLASFHRSLLQLSTSNPIEACAAATAAHIQLGTAVNVWSADSAEHWICRCEMASASCEVENVLSLLSAFVSDGRSCFEETLFNYQRTDEDIALNMLNCALLRALNKSCSKVHQMNSSLRDFVGCALVTSLESCMENLTNSSPSELFILFSTFSIRLFNECSRISDVTKEDPAYAPFREDWCSFFSTSAEGAVISWFLSLADKDLRFSNTLVNALSLSIHFCSEDSFHSAKLPPRFDAELDAKSYPMELQSLVIPLISLLSDQNINVQFAALRILRSVTHAMFLLENKSDTNEEEGEGKLDVTRKKFLPTIILRLLQMGCEGEVPVCILAWDAIVSSLAQFEILERVAYFHILNTTLDDIMPRLFKLLPANPLIDDILLDDAVFRRDRSDYSLPLSSHYSFGLFYRTLVTLPALVRQWYISLPRAASGLINKYTSNYITPLIWKRERQNIATHEGMPNLKVRVLGAVREIVAEYEMEDSSMVLNIELPPDYPLSVPIIENEKAIVGKDTKRKWLLQLTLFLTQQNGSVVDGIMMWARNIERHLSGAEDCTICMMTVHSTSYQLPRVRCRQCKNKFHSDCLYKWFESSKQSSCPLCRANFS